MVSEHKAGRDTGNLGYPIFPRGHNVDLGDMFATIPEQSDIACLQGIEGLEVQLI